MQGFYWDVTPGAVWYDTLAHYAPLLHRVGFDAIWFPPPSKGAAGAFDVGYTPYDYYDLGEFDSAAGDNTSGTGQYIPTRYGTRAGLERAIHAYKSRGMEVYADMVLNHRSGGRLEVNPHATHFKNRGGGSDYSPDGIHTYTAFPLTHGSGRVAWPEGQGHHYFFPNAIRNPSNTGDFFSNTQLAGFHQMYSNYFGYDNALHNGDGSNLPLGDSLMAWGNWLVEEIGFDGFRFDFVKGIHPEYFKRFMNHGAMSGKYAVHELFDGDMNRLKTYLNQISGSHREGAVFDFNLRFAYKEMSDGGNGWDIRNLHTRALFTQSGVSWNRIATFVDNHDFDRLNYNGQVGADGHSPVVNKKAQAYAHMLTHPGLATVWWRDYMIYGMRNRIGKLVMIRKAYASGGLRILTAFTDASGSFQAPQWSGNASDDPKQVYVAQRLGHNNQGNNQSGLIVAINKHSSFPIDVWVTSQIWKPAAGQTTKLYDITGNTTYQPTVYPDGRVLIKTQPNSYHVFVPLSYTLDEVVNVAVTEFDLPTADLRIGDTFTPRIQVENRSTFATGMVEFVFQLRDSLNVIVHTDTLRRASMQAGNAYNFTFSSVQFHQAGEFHLEAYHTYASDQDSTDNLIRYTIQVSDTTQIYPFRVDGIRSEGSYQTIAIKQNDNTGFGLGKDIRSVHIAESADSLYVFIEGYLLLTDADGFGLMLDMTEKQGLSAGTPITRVPNGSYYLNTSHSGHTSFAFDFEVDYGFALFGAQSGRTSLSMADFTQTPSVGQLIVPVAQSPLSNGTPVTGVNGIRYAFTKSTEVGSGLEMVLPKSAFGLDSGQLRIFAFVVSNTAYYSNVLVPGDAVGTAGTNQNFGFNTDFSALPTGGPFHSGWMRYGDGISDVSVDRKEDSTPKGIRLWQNYPNPFNPSTVIGFQLVGAQGYAHVQARLTVYDILGREVAVLVDGLMQAGAHSVTFDASNLTSGIYIYKLEAGGDTVTRRMTLIK